MKIATDLSENVQAAINDFVQDTEDFFVTGGESDQRINLRVIAQEINVLPVVFDWFDSWGIRSDGEIILFNFERPYKIDIVQNQKIINMVLFDAAYKYPVLASLKPVRNAEAITCPGCSGSGVYQEFADHELLSKAVRCNCGGVGWLPSADPKYLYF